MNTIEVEDGSVRVPNALADNDVMPMALMVAEMKMPKREVVANLQAQTPTM